MCGVNSQEHSHGQEMRHPMTDAEEKRHKAGIPRKIIVEGRIWKKRPDGLTITIPTPETHINFECQ